MWLRAGVAPGRPGRRAASRRSRGSRSRWRPSSRRPPSAASRGTGRSAGRASSGVRLRGLAWRRPATGRAIDVDPAAEPGALGDGVVDQHLVVAVGERRRRAAARPAARRRRRRRSPGRARRRCRRSPRRGRRAGPPPRGRPAPIRAGLRSRISFGRSRWPSHSWSGCLRVPGGRRRRAVDLALERVLAAGADLRDGHRRRGRRSRSGAGCVAASSVAIVAGRRCPRRRSVEKVSTGPRRLAARPAMNVARSAITATTGWPVTKVIRSSQCEPMSPTARSAPPWSGSSRQFQSVSRSSQSWK